MGQIEIGFATDGEAPACQAILPSARAETRELLIARRGGAFAGAAAIVWRNEHRALGFPVEVTVLPEHRRRGVGRALLDAAEKACAEETDALRSGRRWKLDSGPGSFLAACGFEPRQILIEFGGPMTEVLGRLGPLRRRLAGRGGVGRLRIVRLEEIPTDRLKSVAFLIARELGGDAAVILGGLKAMAAAPDGVLHAIVALEGDEPTGAFIGRIVDNVAHIESRVVAEPWRGGVANLMLLDRALETGVGAGAAEVRFKCEDVNKDTLILAELLGMREVDREAMFRRGRRIAQVR